MSSQGRSSATAACRWAPRSLRSRQRPHRRERERVTMADVSTDLLEMALREIAAARTEPWYPSVYCQATGVSRDALDRCLDQLRLAGLVRLTDWEQGRGQGYALTPEGQVVLDNPRLL